MTTQKTVVAKANFELLSTEKSASKVFYFKTRHTNLLAGQKVWVISRGKKIVANFLGYEENPSIEPTSHMLKGLSHKEFKAYREEIERKLVKHPLGISNEALEQYRTMFKGNLNVTEEMATLKLTRNVLLSSANQLQEDNSFKFKYGNQLITVKNHTVIEVEAFENKAVFRKDVKKYNELSKKLGITHF